MINNKIIIILVCYIFNFRDISSHTWTDRMLNAVLTILLMPLLVSRQLLHQFPEEIMANRLFIIKSLAAAVVMLVTILWHALNKYLSFLQTVFIRNGINLAAKFWNKNTALQQGSLQSKAVRPAIERKCGCWCLAWRLTIWYVHI